MQGGRGPVALKLAVAKAKPHLRPHVHAIKLTWEEARPALEKLGTADKLSSVSAKAATFLTELLASSGPAAPPRLRARLRSG